MPGLMQDVPYSSGGSHEMNTRAISGRRVAGWVGVLAALLGLFNIISFMAAGGNMEGRLNPSLARRAAYWPRCGIQSKSKARPSRR